MHFDGETEVRLAVLDAADEETHESRFERDEMYSSRSQMHLAVTDVTDCDANQPGGTPAVARDESL